MDVANWVESMKTLHESTRAITKQKVQRQATKFKKEQKAYDIWRRWSCVVERKSKLMPRGYTPFKVVKYIDNNAYKIDIPPWNCLVNDTFNVSDLSSLQDDIESRMNLPQREGVGWYDTPFGNHLTKITNDKKSFYLTDWLHDKGEYVPKVCATCLPLWMACYLKWIPYVCSCMNLKVH
jgi:hypothetical protein